MKMKYIFLICLVVNFSLLSAQPDEAERKEQRQAYKVCLRNNDGTLISTYCFNLYPSDRVFKLFNLIGEVKGKKPEEFMLYDDNKFKLYFITTSFRTLISKVPDEGLAYSISNFYKMSDLVPLKLNEDPYFDVWMSGRVL